MSQARLFSKFLLHHCAVIKISKAFSSDYVNKFSFRRNQRQILPWARRTFSALKDELEGAKAERAAEGVVLKPLDASQMSKLVELLQSPPPGEEEFLLSLLTNSVPPGVDEAAYVKAAFLTAIAEEKTKSPLVTPEFATDLLATMQGGYNIATLVNLLDSPKLGARAANGLSKTLLLFESFHDVVAKAKAGNEHAKKVLNSWAQAEWFTSRPPVAKKITLTVFKVRE
jgi:aconitate hydratase 2/2-methylisocitrate dehydratase